MKRTSLVFASIATLVLLLAGCGSGGIGDIFGNTPQSSSYPSGSSDIYGTVNSVDSRNVYVSVNDYNGQRTMTVPYDSRTQVTYQGQYGRVSQLERGDQIRIRTTNNGVADLITVTQSVSSSSYPGTYPSSNASTGRVVGTVNYVDTAANLIQVNTSYVTGLRTSSNNTVTIYYDSRTRVLYQGRTYTPADLERGDQVDVTTYSTGSGGYLADTITVTRSVRQ